MLVGLGADEMRNLCSESNCYARVFSFTIVEVWDRRSSERASLTPALVGRARTNLGSRCSQ